MRGAAPEAPGRVAGARLLMQNRLDAEPGRAFRVHRAQGTRSPDDDPMNFHDKDGAADARDAERLIYQPAPREAEPPVRPAQRILAMAGAPITGSALVFPARFDRAATLLQRDPTAVDVNPDAAAWYFGPDLHLEISPERLVERLRDYVLDRRGARWIGTSFLDAADWAAVRALVEESPVHREMSELVAAGADFRDTRAYRNLVYAIEVGRPSSRNGVRITSTEEIEAYFEYCRDLIKSARKRGVVRRSVSGAFHRLRVKHRDTRSPAHDTKERDIGVAIDAEGGILRILGGKHRTAIAKALKLPWLPVEVRLVHVAWLADQMRATGLPAHQALRKGVGALRERELAAGG